MVIDDFIGYTFNEVLEFYKETEDYLELQKIIKLPLNTKYELLSSGELVKFHLLYSLLISPTSIYIDDSLSSLSSEAVSKCSKFLKKYSEDHLIVICSHKELPEIEFDKTITIDKNTIFDPNFCLSNKNIVSSNQIINSSLPNKRFISFARILSLLVFLFTSLFLNTHYFNSDYKNYKDYIKTHNYLFMDNCETQICKRDTNDYSYQTIKTRLDDYKQIYFIVSDKAFSISSSALNYFIGKDNIDKMKDAKHYFSTYFDINLSGKIVYNTLEPIVTITKDMLPSLYDKLMFNGLYLSDSIDILDVFQPSYYDNKRNKFTKEEIMKLLNESEIKNNELLGNNIPSYPAIIYKGGTLIDQYIRSDYFYDIGYYVPLKERNITIPLYAITTTEGLNYFHSLEKDTRTEGHNNRKYTIKTNSISKYINSDDWDPNFDNSNSILKFKEKDLIPYYLIQSSLIVLLLIIEVFLSKVKSSLELRNGVTCTKYTLKEYCNELLYTIFPSIVFYALGILLVACLRIEFSPLITLVPLPFILLIPFLSILIKTRLSLKKIK